LERLEEQKKLNLIKTNKNKIVNYIQELPKIIENIFEEEKDLSLIFMNITLNE